MTDFRELELIARMEREVSTRGFPENTILRDNRGVYYRVLATVGTDTVLEPINELKVIKIKTLELHGWLETERWTDQVFREDLVGMVDKEIHASVCLSSFSLAALFTLCKKDLL